jgi:hypothetical protein
MLHLSQTVYFTRRCGQKPELAWLVHSGVPLLELGKRFDCFVRCGQDLAIQAEVAIPDFEQKATVFSLLYRRELEFDEVDQFLEPLSSLCLVAAK